MIRKLQKKFIGITMLSLVAVLLLVIGTINGINIYQTSGKSDALLTMLTDNGGSFPQDNPGQKNAHFSNPDATTGTGNKKNLMQGEENTLFGFRMSAETPFETRYFSVTQDAEGNISIDVTHIASISEAQAQEFADSILVSNKSGGYVGQYRYRVTKTDMETLLVFVDCANDLNSIRNFAVISLLVGLACILLVLLLVVVLSGHAIRPMIENAQKQKQFITDAGHEIKTPIAIISANTEVLEMCDGENEWTKSIHHQVDRLNDLVKNLLTLAKLDEMQEKLPMERMNLSVLVRDVSENFEAPETARNLHTDIQAEASIMMKGEPNSLRHLVSILMDNAVKYASEDGELSVWVRESEHHIEMRFYNSCEEVPDGDLSRLFDRFYRADPSRARETGGYGIGLSVAAAIVHAHKGKIQAIRQGEGIAFVVTLPKGLE